MAGEGGESRRRVAEKEARRGFREIRGGSLRRGPLKNSKMLF